MELRLIKVLCLMYLLVQTDLLLIILVIVVMLSANNWTAVVWDFDTNKMGCCHVIHTQLCLFMYIEGQCLHVIPMFKLPTFSMCSPGDYAKQEQ